MKAEGLQGLELSRAIEDRIEVENILKETSKIWDGGYVICGQTGSGDMFAFRDPMGIRPAFYYYDDEVVVVASERPVIQTSMYLDSCQVNELEPGHCLVVTKAGKVKVCKIADSPKNASCSFERIYFSRGSDKDIYMERKELGHNLSEQILRSIDYDLEHTVFSFIPNTAEVAFYGMIEGLDRYLTEKKIEMLTSGHFSKSQIAGILSMKVRSEKVAIKDIKLRTFITEDSSRDDLAAHVYDITYGTVKPEVDNLNAHSFLPEKEMNALVEKYRHPILKKYGEMAKEVGGHGGMDFIMDARLVYCLQNGLPLDMDVYDLAEWCCLAELGELSMDNNSAPVEFPDFTRGDWNKVKGYRHAFATPEDEAEAARKAEAYTQKLKLQGAEDWK